MHECMDTVAVLIWSGILYKSFPFFWIINLLQTIYKQASYTRSAINSVPHCVTYSFNCICRCQRGWWAGWHVYHSGSSECCWELYYWCKELSKSSAKTFRTLHCLMSFSFTILHLVVLRLNVQDLKAMTDAAGNRPVILINPRLKVQYLL